VGRVGLEAIPDGEIKYEQDSFHNPGGEGERAREIQ
jgi:hypothetical protein